MGRRTPNTTITLLPDVMLPIVFIVAWSYLLAFHEWHIFQDGFM
jgi:hypothetical protein